MWWYVPSPFSLSPQKNKHIWDHARKFVEKCPLELIVKSFGLRANKTPQKGQVSVAQEDRSLTLDECATVVFEAKRCQPNHSREMPQHLVPCLCRYMFRQA